MLENEKEAFYRQLNLSLIEQRRLIERINQSILKELEIIAGRDECLCDDSHPYEKCSSCTAANTLNQISEDARNGLAAALKRKKEEKEQKLM